jgi:hypothetical protein
METNKSRKFKLLLADNKVRDDGVAGSNPATPTRKIKGLAFPKTASHLKLLGFVHRLAHAQPA